MEKPDNVLEGALILLACLIFGFVAGRYTAQELPLGTACDFRTCYNRLPLSVRDIDPGIDEVCRERTERKVREGK